MTERYDTGRGQLIVAAPVEPAREPTVAIIIIVIIVIILLIVLIIYLIWRRRNLVTTPPSNTIECINTANCSPGLVCSPAGKCVECLGDQNCPLSAPVCDTTSNRCTQCRQDSECPTGASRCNQTTRRCVQCVSNSQCTIDKPLCNPNSGSCVECFDNGQCIRPKTCLNGSCCDIVPPTLTSLTAFTGINPLVTITGTYTTSPGQPQSNQVAIAEISDRDNVPLKTTAGVPAVGTISVVQQTTNETPRFFAGYPYQMRVRVSTPCGQTAYGNRLTTTIPTPNGAIVPVISAASGDRNGVTIFLSNPPANTLPITWEPRVYLTNQNVDKDGFLDPNRALVQENTVVTTSFPTGITLHVNTSQQRLLKVFAPWPSGSGAIQQGQLWFVRVGGLIGINLIVVSQPVQFTVQ